MVKRESELKCKFKLAGVSQKDVATFCDVPYSTMASWLDGYAPMPEDVRKKIELFLSQTYSKKAEVSNGY